MHVLSVRFRDKPEGSNPIAPQDQVPLIVLGGALCPDLPIVGVGLLLRWFSQRQGGRMTV